MKNTSGEGRASVVPTGVDRWNWGAFFLNWIWGVGNNTFIALLMFVPLVNFIMLFVLGAKGSSWAWQNKKWDSVEHFHKTQRKWAWWGAAIWLSVIATFIAIFFAIAAAMKSSEAYKLAVAKLEANEMVIQSIGAPITTGIPMGEIQVSGPSGSAKLSFSLKGPKGEGTAYLEANKSLGLWKIERLAFEQQSTGQRIEFAE
jgi:hypothetical protein